MWGPWEKHPLMGDNQWMRALRSGPEEDAEVVATVFARFRGGWADSTLPDLALWQVDIEDAETMWTFETMFRAQSEAELNKYLRVNGMLPGGGYMMLPRPEAPALVDANVLLVDALNNVLERRNEKT